jgi:hypothetical protein
MRGAAIVGAISTVIVHIGVGVASHRYSVKNASMQQDAFTESAHSITGQG